MLVYMSNETIFTYIRTLNCTFSVNYRTCRAGFV